MNYYNGFLSEFLSSSYCYEETSAKFIIGLLDEEKLVEGVIGDSNLSVEWLIKIEDSQLTPYLKENIDILLSGAYKLCLAEDMSVLSYLTKSLAASTPDDEQNLLLTHRNRKEGELFESTLAGILYSRNDDTNKAENDLAVLKSIVTILASEVIASVKQWLKANNGNNEFHKIISKFLLNQSSISKSYILGLIELVGVSSFFDKVKTVGDVADSDITGHYNIKPEDVVALSIKNSEDVLIAVRSITDKDQGVFFAISRELDLPESVYSEKIAGPEIQVAKLFKRASDEDSLFWQIIGLASIRVISAEFNKFRASTMAPAPSIDG